MASPGSGQPADPVASAGEVTVGSDGRLEFNNHSGTFLPEGQGWKKNLEEALKRAGIDPKDVTIKDIFDCNKSGSSG